MSCNSLVRSDSRGERPSTHSIAGSRRNLFSQRLSRVIDRVQSACFGAVEILYPWFVAEEVAIIELDHRGIMIRWYLERETAQR